MKLPAIQFYVNDWRNEQGLQLSSLAAHGLWINMLCLMSQSPRRGYLEIGDRPITHDELALLVRTSVDEVQRLLKELSSGGVYSIDDDGFIFSRRMVRDERMRRANFKNGKLGGNPSLVSRVGNGGVNPPNNHQDNQPLEDEDEDEDEIPEILRKPGFERAWRDYLRHLSEKNEPLTRTARKKAIEKLAEMGVMRASSALNYSVSNGWKGIFEPNEKSPERSKDRIDKVLASRHKDARSA